MIDILGEKRHVSFKHVHKIEFKIKFEPRFINATSKKQPRQKKIKFLFSIQ